MKLAKKIGITFLVVMGMILLLAVWYNYTFSMKDVMAYDVNSPSMSKSILIATQGSDFKDTITKDIIDHYKEDLVYIRVIDVKELIKILPDQYNAIVIMHTWENWRPPKEVKYFIDKNSVFRDKMVVLTTSGEGSYKMEDVDALTGESILVNTKDYSERIIDQIEGIFKNQDL